MSSNSQLDATKPTWEGRLARTLHTVERPFDRIWSGYKWRFGRWKHPRIEAYRGYGTRERLFLRGRVLDEKAASEASPEQSIRKNVIDTLRHIASDEIPRARVRLAFQDQVLEARTDEEGYFVFEVEPKAPLPTERVWHEAKLDLIAPAPKNPTRGRETALVFVPPPDADFGIISDLDDTVVRTGATNKFRMTRTVLLNNAHTRIPFPGVSALYRALQRGPEDRAHNPIFYLSSSPWNLYGFFMQFFVVHDLPLGPVFLRDFGLSREQLFSAGHHAHKLQHIRMLLETYPDLPFVLIGDSGQEDPEIYRQAAQEHPEQIRAIFIRDVATPSRSAEVHTLAREVSAQGFPMHLVKSSAEAAGRAVELNLIPEGAVEEVRVDKAEDEAHVDEPGLAEQALRAPSEESRQQPSPAVLAALSGAALGAAVAARTAWRRKD